MYGCSDCPFFQNEQVESPFTGLVETVRLCVAGKDDDCPMEAVLADDYEVVVSCHRCGGECDGYGAIDGLAVCPRCDSL